MIVIFESKLGLGEICCYFDSPTEQKKGMEDFFVKVVEISFKMDGPPQYLVEHMTKNAGLQRFVATESLLGSDPDYDHDLGGYPEDLD
jgi:uncharacterized protein YfaT (DUF1175 family)